MKARLLIICAALMLLGGVANGVMDTLSFHYGASIFPKDSQYWNKNLSWKNKWKQVDGELVQPLTPRFFGSSTFLVFLTDGWHFFQMIMFAAFRTALVLALASAIRLAPGWKNVALWILVWIGLHVVQAAGFHLMYTWVLV
jgi:hypothetical protein